MIFGKDKKITLNSEAIVRIRNNDPRFGGRLYAQCMESLRKNFNKKYFTTKFLVFERIYDDAFYKFWKKVNKEEIKELTTDIEGYIWGIMKNLINNEIKVRELKELNQKEIFIEDYSRYENFKEEQVDLADLEIERLKKQIVNDAIISLGDPCRSILFLFYHKELSYKEMVGKIPGYTGSDAIKAKSYKCKKLMEDIVKKKFNEYEIDI